MKLKFKSITNLIAKFTPLALFAAMGLALAAPQTAQGVTYYKFTVLGVKTNPTGSNKAFVDRQFSISELALYDGEGNRLNSGLTYVGSASQLTGGKCFANVDNSNSGRLFNGVMSGSDKWWSSTVGTIAGADPKYSVIMCLSSEEPVASYNLATADSVNSIGGCDNRIVTKWKLEKGSTLADDDWQLLDEQYHEDADPEIPANVFTWYNGGTPFEISSSGPTLGEVTLTKTEATWNGSGWATLPTETVKNGDGTVLTKDTHYTIAWKNSSGTSATAATKADTYTLTVTGMGDYDSQTKTATYTVNRMEIGLPPATATSNVKIGTNGKPTTQSLIDAIPSSYKTTWGQNSLYVQLADNGQQTNPGTYQYAKLQLNSGYVNNLKWADGTFGKQTVRWTITETRVEVTLNDNGGSGGQSTVMINPGSPLPTLSSRPTKADSQFGGYYYGDVQYYDAQGMGVRNFPSSSYPTELTAKWTSTSGGQWFRLIIKDVKGPTKSHIQLDELALYDASFNRVNADLVESSTGLNFGECAYSGSGDVVPDAPVGNLFDGNLDRNHMWAREGVSFTEGNYPTITMHLQSDAAPVVYYNFASGGETANRSGSCAPVSWRLERSTDGVNWELFHEQTDVEEPVVENDTWLVNGGTENPPQYVIRGDGKVAEWKKPPRQFIRLTILKTSDGGTGTKTVGPMNIAKIALYDAQGNSIIPTDATDTNLKIALVNTYPQLKVAYDKPTVSDNGAGTGVQHPPRLTEGNTKWLISGAVTLSDVHWYIVTTNDSPLAAYDLRTALTDDITGTCKNRAVLAWRIDTSATGEDDDWQFFDERDFSMYAAEEDSIPFTERTWYGKGSGGDPDPGKAFRPSFLNKVASSPLRIYDSDPDPLATGGDIVLKDGGDYIHVFTNASASATFEAYKGSMLEVLAVGAGGAGSVGGGNAGALADASEVAVNQNSSYTIQVGAGGSGNGGASTVSTVSGVSLSLTANGGTAGGSDGKGGKGAKENGKPMSGNVGGAGGAGTLNAILGWDVTFAGGGGGAGSAGCGAGGLGGGGSQASSDYRSINGEPGLGGGGGGAVSGGTAGVGGSGLVVIRVKDASGLSSVTLDKTLETYGNDGWNVFPDETVLDGSGAPLTKGVDYTATWKDSVGSTVSAPDNVGVYTLTVTASGGRTGMLTATYTVNTRYIVIEHPSVETLYTGKLQTFDPKWAFNEADLPFVELKQGQTFTGPDAQPAPKAGFNLKSQGPVQWWDGSKPDSRKTIDWTIKSEEFDIPLDKNGGSVDPNPSSVHVKTGVALPTLEAGQKLTRDYYTFAGYGDKWDGSGTTYYNENGTPVLASYPATGGAKMLFALWTATPYQVTLMKNDGTQDSEPVNAHYNEYMPDVEVPDRTGWIFEGYFKNQDGTGDQYYNKLGKGILKYTDTSVKTLYAKWTRDIIPISRPTQGSSDLGVYDKMNKKPNIDTNPGYTITYSNSGNWVNAGSYTATIKLNEGYEWDSAPTGETLTFTYTISAKPLKVIGVTVSDREYDGTSVATLNTAGKALDGVCSGDDVQIDSMPTTGTFMQFFGGIDSTPNVGDKLVTFPTGSVTLKGTRAGNYFVNEHDTLGMKVTARVLTLTWGEKSFTYDGNSHCPTCTLGNFVSGEGVGSTPTVTGAETAAGTYTATVADWNFAGTGMKSNYALPTPASTTFTITAKALTDAMVTLSPSSFVYNGANQKPTVTVKDGSTTLVKDTDYTLTNAGGTNVGNNYEVRVVGTGNYSGTITKTFTITAKALTDTMVTLSPSSFVYNGANQKPTVTVKDDSKTLVENTDYTLTNNGGTDVGNSYEVRVVGTGNYSGTITKTFEITKATITAVTLNSTGATYDGQPHQPTVKSVTANGKTFNSDSTGWTVTYSRDDFTSVGTITVEVTGKANLTGSASTTFTITAKALTDAMVTLSASSFVYNGANQKPTVTVKDGSETLVENTDYTLTNAGGTNVGNNYEVRVVGTGNYSGTITKTFEITKATITAVTLNSTGATYDGQSHQPTVASVTTANGKSFTSASTGWDVSYSPNDFTSVGTITVEVTGKANLTGSASTTFTIVGPTVTLNKCGGSEGTDSVVATPGSDMPKIVLPFRNGYSFKGYFTQEGGAGVKYYNADGTSARTYPATDFPTMLYAHWEFIETYYLVRKDGSSGPIQAFEATPTPGANGAGWAETPTGNPVRHTVCAEHKYVASQTLGTPEDLTAAVHEFAGDELKITNWLGIYENVSFKKLISQGGQLCNYKTVPGSVTEFSVGGEIEIVSGSELVVVMAGANRHLNVTADISGGENTLIRFRSQKDVSGAKVVFSGDASGFKGKLQLYDDSFANPFGLYFTDNFGGSVDTLPTKAENVWFNHGGLTDGETKGLAISSTTIPARVKDSITFFGSSNFTAANFPLMTFPAGTTVNLADFTVKHAETEDGAATPFTNLGLRTNSDGTITLVANVNRGLIIVVH